MFRRKSSQQARERATEYATCKDFQQIFDEEMPGLHLLAYLLTADETQAEQCFVAGLDDSIHGNPVFKQWARAWSKRAIIQNAIKAISPAKMRAVQEQPATPKSGSMPPLVAMVMQWPAFERFVFVMAVLEGYSTRECAAMLGCSDQEIIATKSGVLARLAASPNSAPLDKTTVWTALLARTQVA
jgi:DNA-directed RNA polymerase specialized sigma24 family protein